MTDETNLDKSECSLKNSKRIFRYRSVITIINNFRVIIERAYPGWIVTSSNLLPDSSFPFFRNILLAGQRNFHFLLPFLDFYYRILRASRLSSNVFYIATLPNKKKKNKKKHLRFLSLRYRKKSYFDGTRYLKSVCACARVLNSLKSTKLGYWLLSKCIEDANETSKVFFFFYVTVLSILSPPPLINYYFSYDDRLLSS